MLITSTRKPAVSGRFYPSDKEELNNTISKIDLQQKKNKLAISTEIKIYGAIVPHAGYMYSAHQAVHFFSLLKEYPNPVDTFVIVNPNHTGYGDKISLDSHRYWNTPLGNVEQDDEFINHLGIPFSDSAHENEHSGEVMLPFLQHFIDYPFKVVLITLSEQNYTNAKFLAHRIKLAANELNRNIMLIASSDFTHFKSIETSRVLDNMVLKEINNHNPVNLEKTVISHEISVCGFGPIMCLMEYSKLHGSYQTQILARGHSGLISPSDKVVNYITILFNSQ